jgi:hypothetical protein
MRLINFVITAVAVVLGLLGAVFLMMLGLAIYALRRLFGRPAAMPSFQRPVRPSPARPAYSSRDDVIDVVTTKVKD